MTKNELMEAISQIIQQAVMQSGGDWKRSYRPYVEEILKAMGRLSPERDGNIKPEVIDYNKHLIKKVGKQKLTFTIEQRATAKAILRKMGMI